MGKRADLPGVPSNIDPPTRKVLQALVERVRELTGFGGDPSLRALTAGEGGGGSTIIVGGGSGGGGGGGDTTPDLTPPPTPTWHGLPGFDAAAGLTTIQLQWDPPTYTQGHGHAQTNVYGAKWPVGAPQPTFGNGVRIDEVYGPAQVLAALPTELGTRWCLWLKWQSVDGVESTTPAGGTNGIVAQTGLIDGHDLGPLIIEAGHLADGSVTGTKLAAAAVGLTAFANGIAPIGVVATLPDPVAYAGPSVVLVTSDGKIYRYTSSGTWTRAVAATDLAGQITSTQISDGAINTPKLAAGSVTTAVLAAGAVTADTLAVNSVTAGAIAAGAVSATQLAAGAVTAASLAITDLQNLCSNGNGVSTAGWESNGVVEAGSGAFWPGYGVQSNTTLSFKARDSFFGPYFSATLDDSFYVSAEAIPSGGGAALYTTRIGLQVLDSNNVILAFFTFSAVPAGHVGHVTYDSSASLLALPGAAKARVWVQIDAAIDADFSQPGATWHYTNIRMYRRNAGNLLVDGSVTANHLAANSIAVGTAAIQAGAIVNAMLGTAIIDDAKVANLAATKLTAGDGTIGGNLKSANYASGSAGWIVTPAGYAEFNSTVVRGTIYAGAGSIGGIQIYGNHLQSGNYAPGSAGFTINADGSAEFSGATVRGTIYVGSGTLGGITITGSDIRGAYSAGVGGFRIASDGSAEFRNIVARGDIQATSLNATSANIVSTLHLNGESVTIPRSRDFTPDGPWGGGAWLYFDMPFTLTSAGTIYASALVGQGTAGNHWQVYLEINGTRVCDTGEISVPQPHVSVSGSLYVGAGSYTVRVAWFAAVGAGGQGSVLGSVSSFAIGAMR